MPLRRPDSRDRSLAFLGATLVGVLTIAAVTHLLRTRWNVEWNTDSLRALVDHAGLWGPILFVALVAARTIVMIPGALILTAAGALFGTLEGSLYGASGLTLTALGLFGMVRVYGTERVRGHVPARFRGLLDLGRSRAGAGLLALLCGYPVGPSVWAQAGAAASGMALLPFALCVGLGSTLRAATFSYLGESLVAGGGLLRAGTLLGVVLVLPLLHPRVRAQLRRRREGRETPAA